MGTCCQPPRFIFYSRLEWNCHLGLRSFLLNSDWKFFQMKVIKVQDSEFLKRHNSFLVIPSRVLARLSHLEIKCCASLSVWSWVWEWVGPTHVISLSNREGSERANITHCIPYTFLSPSLGAPGQNKTFSETLMFREVRTEELGVAQITKIRSTDTISLSLLAVLALTREEGQSDNEIMTIKKIRQCPALSVQWTVSPSGKIWGHLRWMYNHQQSDTGIAPDLPLNENIHIYSYYIVT